MIVNSITANIIATVTKHGKACPAFRTRGKCQDSVQMAPVSLTRLRVSLTASDNLKSRSKGKNTKGEISDTNSLERPC